MEEEGRGPTFKEDGWQGREDRGRKGRGANPPKVKASRINTGPVFIAKTKFYII